MPLCMASYGDGRSSPKRTQNPKTRSNRDINNDSELLNCEKPFTWIIFYKIERERINLLCNSQDAMEWRYDYNKTNKKNLTTKIHT